METIQGQTFVIMKWDLYGDTGFHSAQTTYLSMKVLTFAKNENIRSTANLSYDQKCSHFSDYTKLHPDMHLWSLV